MPSDLRMKIQVYFDKHFLRLHGNSLERSQIILDEMFQRLQSILCHKSLGTEINLSMPSDPIFIRDMVSGHPYITSLFGMPTSHSHTFLCKGTIVTHLQNDLIYRRTQRYCFFN